MSDRQSYGQMGNSKVGPQIKQDHCLIWAYKSAWLAWASSSNVLFNLRTHFIKCWLSFYSEVAKLIEVYLLESNILKRRFPMYHPCTRGANLAF